MFCRKCGAEIKPNAKFCTKCGTVVTTVNAENVVGNNIVGNNAVSNNAVSNYAVGNNAVSNNNISNSNIGNNNAGGNNSGRQKKKTNVGLIAALIVLVILIVALLLVGAYFIFGSEYLGIKEIQESANELQEQLDEKSITSEEEKSSQATEGTESTVETKTAEETEQKNEQEKSVILGDDSVDPTAIHEYRIVIQDVTWVEAYTNSLEIEGGYLVHINSEEEMNVILQQIESEGYDNCIFWIGGMRAATSEDYYWIDSELNFVGESLNGNAYWLDGEPSYYDNTLGLEERYMDMFYVKSAGRFIWNDTVTDLISAAPGYKGKLGYIIEIEH